MSVCDNDVLEKHHLYKKYHKTLHEISLKDYKKSNYFAKHIDGIDLDMYESAQGSNNMVKTMDAVVGIADYNNKKNKLVNERLLLIELRMNYKNIDNLKPKELKEKINNSRKIIGSSIPVDKENYFVFSEKVSEIATRWMFQFSQEYYKTGICVAVTPKDIDDMLKIK